MSILYYLIPLSLVFTLVAIWAFRFAIRSRQFDDLDQAAQRIILDDRQARRDQSAGDPPA